MSKYTKGKQVVSMVQLAKIFAEGRNIYIRDKYTHQGWAMSMQYRVLMNAVKSGVVYEVVDKRLKEFVDRVLSQPDGDQIFDVMEKHK